MRRVEKSREDKRRWEEKIIAEKEENIREETEIRRVEKSRVE